jgi:leader peptidase (prepilin peptidase)/N-methyltransferase
LGYAFVVGACIGSFLNVAIYRLPAGLSLVSPPSRCPHCHHKLGKTENVPILGWLWLRGRCRWCRSPISIRYLLVETFTAVIFCAIFWRFGLSLTTLGYWLLSSWLIVLAGIDFDTLTLPNFLTKSGLVAGLLFQLLQGMQAGSMPFFMVSAVGSAALGIWLFDGLRWGGTILLGQAAMGGGDPKLASMIGVWLGWQLLLVTSFLACSLGALGGGLAIASGRLDRQHPFPFGPFLALGAILSLFWGANLIEFYKNLFFPVI